MTRIDLVLLGNPKDIIRFNIILDYSFFYRFHHFIFSFSGTP